MPVWNFERNKCSKQCLHCIIHEIGTKIHLELLKLLKNFQIDGNKFWKA